MEDRAKRRARQRRYDQKRKGQTMTIRVKSGLDTKKLASAARRLISSIQEHSKCSESELGRQLIVWAAWIPIFLELGRTIKNLEKLRPDHLTNSSYILKDWTKRIEQMILIQPLCDEPLTDILDKWIQSVKEKQTKDN